MKTDKIDIVIPVFPLYAREAQHQQLFSQAFSELTELSNQISLDIEDYGALEPSISIIDNYEPLFQEIDIESKLHLNAIVFSIKLSLTANQAGFLIKDMKFYSYAEKKSYVLYSIAAMLQDEVHDLLILYQVAKPGMIKCRKSKVYINDVFCKTDSYSVSSIHRESLSEVEKLGWIKYENLDLRTVMKWFTENNLSFKRHSKSKIERALNAFTRLFNNGIDSAEVQLFWAIVGIEALYCTGAESISEQIYRKTQLVLGEMTDYKKRLKQMYNFRSRLIHGNLDIPPNHRYLYDDKSETYQDDLYDSTVLAVSILTASLQFLIKSNRTSFHFKYQLSL